MAIKTQLRSNACTTDGWLPFGAPDTIDEGQVGDFRMENGVLEWEIRLKTRAPQQKCYEDP
jgi:hypothetical protein